MLISVVHLLSRRGSNSAAGQAGGGRCRKTCAFWGEQCYGVVASSAGNSTLRPHQLWYYYVVVSLSTEINQSENLTLEQATDEHEAQNYATNGV